MNNDNKPLRGLPGGARINDNVPIIGQHKIQQIPPALFDVKDAVTGADVKMAVQQVVVVSISEDIIDMIADAVIGRLKANLSKENRDKFASIILA